jgi:phosphoglycolate phosphatase
MLKNIILWDWNGTLLDDISVCVDSINKMLAKRQMRQITIELYKEIFDFPVRNFYSTLGFDFDKDSFEDLSVEYMSYYQSGLQKVKLQESVKDVLYYFQAIGKKQIVISAMEQKMLGSMIKAFEIDGFFDDIVGLSDIYANGKIELARSYIARTKLDTADAVFIGDTLHDAEVAESIGVDVILVMNGHHSVERLSVNGYHLVKNLSLLIDNSPLVIS